MQSKLSLLLILALVLFNTLVAHAAPTSETTPAQSSSSNDNSTWTFKSIFTRLWRMLPFVRAESTETPIVVPGPLVWELDPMTHEYQHLIAGHTQFILRELGLNATTTVNNKQTCSNCTESNLANDSNDNSAVVLLQPRYSLEVTQIHKAGPVTGRPVTNLRVHFDVVGSEDRFRYGPCTVAMSQLLSAPPRRWVVGHPVCHV